MSQFLKSISKSFGDVQASVLDSGTNSGEISGFIDTGSYILNAAICGSLYGGVPSNKVTAFAGESSVGKTFFVLAICQSFIQDNPDGVIVYYETEGAVTKKMFEERGIDPKRVLIVEPTTIQKFREAALKFLTAYEEAGKSRPKVLFVLDSLGMLPTNKELADAEEGKDVKDMTRSSTIRSTFRTLSLKLARLDVALLLTNHVYEVVGAYVPTKEMGGGAGTKYASSTIVYLSKSKERDSDKKVIGSILKCKMHKSRLTREEKVVEVALRHETGLDRWYGLLPLAELAGVVKKVSKKYEFIDGTTAFESAILKNGEKYFKPYLEQLEAAAAKEFKFGEGEEPSDEEVDDIPEEGDE